MLDDLTTRLALHYRGRHLPDDALWWLDHPDSPGPSSAPPPQQAFLEAIAYLEDEGNANAARALESALQQILEFDRRAALDALLRARSEVCLSD